MLRRPLHIAGAEPEGIPVEPVGNEIVSLVDGWTPGKERIRGWAADLRDLGSHQQVVAFLRRREFWVGETGRRHPEAAEQAGHLYSGFGLPDNRYSTSDKATGPRADDLVAIEREGLVVYAVSRRKVAARLPFTYRRLERIAGNAEILPVSNGRRLLVQAPEKGFRSAFHLVARPGQGTLIEGWAADSERSERPREIVIYRGGEFLARFGSGQEQRDLAEHDNDPRPLATSFRGPVPGVPDPETFADRHRVFAIMLRGVAVELPYLAPTDPPR